jgi:molybdopterin-guanine dinucleotide biosynthesis protein A
MCRGLGAVIIAGGKSRRMLGIDKSQLRIEGKTFLERISEELAYFGETLLSVAERTPYLIYGIPIVKDIFPDCGAMGGIYSALGACRFEALFAIASDMPLFRRELVQYLYNVDAPHYDALVTVSRDGRVHPLCAIYRKSARHVFEEKIKSGNYRMMDALACMRTFYISLGGTVFPDEILYNVNTPGQYARVRNIAENCSIPRLGWPEFIFGKTFPGALKGFEFQAAGAAALRNIK